MTNRRSEHVDASEVMRRVRYALEIDDAEAVSLVVLGGGIATLDDVEAWRTRPDQAGHRSCPVPTLYHFMDGLVADRRGPPARVASAAVAAPPAHVDNNRLLKSLRVALSLQGDALHALFRDGGADVSANEVAALLRKPGTRNYRRCGDQLLRKLLDGIAHRRLPRADD